MKVILEQLAKIPLRHVVVLTALFIAVMLAFQLMPWPQSVVEHYLGMEGIPK